MEAEDLKVAPPAGSNLDAADALRRTLLENISSGKWLPAEKLPTERQLSQQFHIGRAVVRRVLGELRGQGIIVQAVGSGTFVAERKSPEGAAVAPIASSVSPAHLMDARFLLEPAIIDLVVTNATPADLSRMDACCENAETAATNEEFEHWDGMLHKAIADAAHNSFFTAVFELMIQVREQGEWGQLKKKSLTAERRKTYEQEHRALVNALRQRDAELAKDMASKHLHSVRKNLLGTT